MQNQSGSLFENMRTSPSFQIIAVALSLVSSQGAWAEFTPVLNEIMASNDVTLADEDGEFSDWIEIRNSGDTAGNLNGWFLTDDAANTTRWAFPSTPLAPGELLVVFASNKN
ncbi:MAG: lamin tail domain-containing protein, partial [SAR202 cluster bacterium]|nr:lamin tail domain-containing protein [SAR202 cluster bacterium]